MGNENTKNLSKKKVDFSKHSTRYSIESLLAGIFNLEIVV